MDQSDRMNSPSAAQQHVELTRLLTLLGSRYQGCQRYRRWCLRCESSGVGETWDFAAWHPQSLPHSTDIWGVYGDWAQEVERQLESHRQALAESVRETPAFWSDIKATVSSAADSLQKVKKVKEKSRAAQHPSAGVRTPPERLTPTKTVTKRRGDLPAVAR